MHFGSAPASPLPPMALTCWLSINLLPLPASEIFIRPVHASLSRAMRSRWLPLARERLH